MIARNLEHIGGKEAAEALNSLLPSFRESSEPQVRQMLPSLEGLARSLNMLGNLLELEGKLLDGTELDWDSYRGKVVLVDFWATWCGPCREEIPNVLENYKTYHEKGFDVVGISLDNTHQQAESYVKENNIPWVTVFSGQQGKTGWNAPMAERYAIDSIPKAILVDQEGNVIHLNARGPLLSRQLSILLGEPDIEVEVEEVSEESDVSADAATAQ